MITLKYPSGATPLDIEEIEDLIPSHITTQGQLNEWEAINILKAEQWLFLTKHLDIVSLKFIRLLHKKMFNETWGWAGIFRKTQKNIGVEASMITSKLTELLDDVKYQIENHTYSIDEISFRFHHRLVAIHPFPNGNGRHSRLMSDILLVSNDSSRFSWGAKMHKTEDLVRRDYIQSLKNADRHDYELLSKFVRS